MPLTCLRASPFAHRLQAYDDLFHRAGHAVNEFDRPARMAAVPTGPLVQAVEDTLALGVDVLCLDIPWMMASGPPPGQDPNRERAEAEETTGFSDLVSEQPPVPEAEDDADSTDPDEEQPRERQSQKRQPQDRRPQGERTPDQQPQEQQPQEQQPPEKRSQEGQSQEESEKTEPEAPSGDFPTPVRASTVEVRSVEWLWDGYLARGMLHMLNGDPGHGKSTLLLTLAARFSKGKTPDGQSIAPVNTLYLSAEDQADVTLVPRYRAAVGTTDRLLVVDAAKAMDLSLPAHTEELETVLRRHDIQFCVVDPLFSFLDRDHEKNSEQDIRAVLSELTNVAEATGCAFVLVRHFNKKENLSAVYRGGGSIGITAQARLGFALAPHPDRPETDRVLAWTKNNLSDKSLREALVFRQDTHPVPEAGRQPTLEFQGTEQWSADELLSRSQGQQGRPPDKLRAAKQFLQDELEAGRTRSTALYGKLEEKNFSESTLRRAKGALGVETKQDGDGWWWHFPGEEPGEGDGLGNDNSNDNGAIPTPTQDGDQGEP